MKRAILCLCLLVFLTANAVRTVGAQGDSENSLITLYKKSVKLREALSLISNADPEAFSVDPKVEDVELTLNLERVTEQQATRLIIRQAGLLMPGLTTFRDGGPLSVARYDRKPDPVAEELLSFANTKGEAAVIWPLVFDGTDFKPSLAREVQTLPVLLTAKKAPRRVVVYQLLRQLSERVSNLSVASSYEWNLQRTAPAPAKKGNGT